MEETNSTPPVLPAAEETLGQRMGSFLWFVLVFVAFVLGVGAGYLAFARPLESQLTAAVERAVRAEQQVADNSAAAEQTAAEQAQGNEQQVRRYDISIDDDPILGKSDAQITIIEFSDYECPFCRRWHQEVLPQIKEKYGDKVRFVFRDFPLYSIHPNAGPAAEAANCAGEQDQYWAFNTLLFESETLGPAVYDKLANQVGLNIQDFKTCMDEKRYEAEVNADYEYASGLGVRSTPTFFINGLAIVGAQPFDVFEQVIDMELAGEIP